MAFEDLGLPQTQVECLKHSLGLMGEFTKEAPKPIDPEAQIVREVIEAWGTQDKSVDLRLKWAEWVAANILWGEGAAFEKMALFVAGLRKKAPDGNPDVQLPEQVALPDKFMPRKHRGAPTAEEKPDSNKKLFAKAAELPVSLASLFRDKLPSAKQIRDELNKLRRALDSKAPDVSDAEFSRCVTAFKLNGLLFYERKPSGPTKGSTQVARAESGARLRRNRSKNR